MPRRRLVSQRLVALFLLGCLLFNYPLLEVFGGTGGWFGWPAIYAWLMGGWLALIVLMALVVERPGTDGR